MEFIGNASSKRRAASVGVQMQSAVNTPACEELAHAKVKMKVFSAARARGDRGGVSRDGDHCQPGSREQREEGVRQHRQNRGSRDSRQQEQPESTTAETYGLQ